jgi:hypothetical protein
MIEDNNLKITKVLGVEGYTTYFMIIEAVWELESFYRRNFTQAVA